MDEEAIYEHQEQVILKTLGEGASVNYGWFVDEISEYVSSKIYGDEPIILTTYWNNGIMEDRWYSY